MTQPNHQQEIIDKLNAMNQYVTDCEAEANRLTGQKDQILAQIKTELGCKNLQEAITYSGNIQNQLADLDRELVADVATLEQELGWLNHGGTATNSAG